MAKSRFENAEQWNTKREIDRINRQIKQAFTKFGADSRLAKQYETILQGSEDRMLEGSISKARALNQRTGLSEPIMRYTKDGIPQISTGKATLREFTMISAMKSQLENLGRMQTVQTVERHMIEAYKARHGLDELKGREQKKHAIAEELKRYNTLENDLSKWKNQLYDYQDKFGVSLQAVQELKRLSKGRWTSEETLREMIEIAKHEALAEKKQIVEDAFSQNQW